MEFELEQLLSAHKDAIYAIEPTSNGLNFLTAGADQTVLEWDLSQPDQARRLAKGEASIYYLKLLSDNRLIIGTNAGHLYCIDHKEKKVLAERKFNLGIFDGQVDTKNDCVYLAFEGGGLAKIDLSTFDILEKGEVSKEHIRVLRRGGDGLLYSGSSDGRIRIHKPTNLETTHEFKAHSDSVFSLYINEDGALCSGGKDAMLKWWVIKNGEYETINEVPAHLFTVNEIIEGPEYNQITTASRDKTIKIWEKGTLVLHKVLDREKYPGSHSHSVNRIAWLNGEQLISGGDDRILRIWRLRKPG